MRLEGAGMKIVDVLRREFVLDELKAQNKRDVLAELCGVFAKEETGADTDSILKVLLERERLGSTGIGDGIAIPHGKIQGLDGMMVSFGRSRQGISFDAMDGKPVHLFFLLMAPENSAGQHLKILARISRMLKDAAFRDRLLEVKAGDDLFKIITDKDDEC